MAGFWGNDERNTPVPSMRRRTCVFSISRSDCLRLVSAPLLARSICDVKISMIFVTPSADNTSSFSTPAILEHTDLSPMTTIHEDRKKEKKNGGWAWGKAWGVVSFWRLSFFCFFFLIKNLLYQGHWFWNLNGKIHYTIISLAPETLFSKPVHIQIIIPTPPPNPPF